LDLKALANEFDISTTRVSKIQREIERMDKADLKLQQLLRQYKVKQRPHLFVFPSYKQVLVKQITVSVYSLRSPWYVVK